jgi:hypothetical protein
MCDVFLGCGEQVRNVRGGEVHAEGDLPGQRFPVEGRPNMHNHDSKWCTMHNRHL